MKQDALAIVWFRNDLRITDNPALSAALDRYQKILPVYIHAPHEHAPWEPGEASNWWLHHSLDSLGQSLESMGSYLLLKKGNSLETLQTLIEKTGAKAVFWNRMYEPALIKRDAKIKKLFKVAGINCQSFNGQLLTEPHTILNNSGSAFKVFSAYWRKTSREIDSAQQLLPAPQEICSPQLSDSSGLSGFIKSSSSLKQLELLPEKNWYQGFYNHWEPGEQGGRKSLINLIENTLNAYKINHDIPSVSGTSRLSPHLHFGEVSAREVFSLCQQNSSVMNYPIADMEKFISELGWREFAYYLMYHFPDSTNQSLDQRFDLYGWVDESKQPELLQQWQQGKTGIPIVDAGMRELWQTGWMHNRVRMITASILTKNMGFHWISGARWFWDTLIDADLAANTLGWQWTAGCGVDAAPYFRIFSPARQTERFDADGTYIKHWLPELQYADKHVLMHGLSEPNAKIDYPTPIIDLAASRQSALLRWDSIKNSNLTLAV